MVFRKTKRENIKEAKLEDGGKLVIAAFDKDNGKKFAMVDHRDLPENKDRIDIQRSLIQRLDKIFSQA
ncbi:MAG: hypothetical protein ABIN94_12180 [Ferruginibacter sp.]